MATAPARSRPPSNCMHCHMRKRRSAASCWAAPPTSLHNRGAPSAAGGPAVTTPPPIVCVRCWSPVQKHGPHPYETRAP
eukprot:3938966-Pyramimonas_sp.AAC.1